MPETAQYYHLMYTREELNEKAIDAVKKCIKSGLWKVQNNDEGNKILRVLAKELSEIYNIPVPDVMIDDEPIYYTHYEQIGMISSESSHKFSITSFLHEYGHHRQKYNLGKKELDAEDDARAYSISMFRYALPKSFDLAWKNGTIYYMLPYDPTVTEIAVTVKDDIDNEDKNIPDEEDNEEENMTDGDE